MNSSTALQMEKHSNAIGDWHITPDGRAIPQQWVTDATG